MNETRCTTAHTSCAETLSPLMDVNHVFPKTKASEGTLVLDAVRTEFLKRVHRRCVSSSMRFGRSGARTPRFVSGYYHCRESVHGVGSCSTDDERRGANGVFSLFSGPRTSLPCIPCLRPPCFRNSADPAELNSISAPSAQGISTSESKTSEPPTPIPGLPPSPGECGWTLGIQAARIVETDNTFHSRKRLYQRHTPT